MVQVEERDCVPTASPWGLFAQLPLRPRVLPWAALRCTGVAHVATASALVLMEVVLIALAAYAGLDEPYPDLAAYLLSVGAMVPQALLGATIVLGPAILTLTLVVSLGPPRAHARGRLFLYAPLVLIVPLLIWVPLAILARIADPAFGLAAAKPAWARFTGIRFVGAPWGVLIFLALNGALIMRAARRIPSAARRHDAGRACGECGYMLIGLDSLRCPECGSTIPHPKRG